MDLLLFLISTVILSAAKDPSPIKITRGKLGNFGHRMTEPRPYCLGAIA